MAGSEWEHFGREIRKTVQDAVENQDYHKLNQMVTETLNKAMNGRAVRPGYQNATRPVPPNMSLYRKTSGDTAVGWVLSIICGVPGAGLVFFALATLLVGTVNGFPTKFWTVFLFLGISAAACLGVTGYGISLLRSVKRFQRYIQRIGSREYCDVKEIAAVNGRSEAKTVKDLEKMIRKGWFCQGHFDEDKKCFMTSDRMYQEYRRLDGQRKTEAARLEAQRQAEVRRAEDLNSKLPPEARKVIEAGDAFVKRIRACNDAIPGEEISAKISRMEMIVDRIFDRVEQNPETISDIRKLMEYYLPTTIKLLEAYQELDDQPVAGENIQSSKREIEATLDTLNVAFEKILDDLFHHTAWDVSSDISVLNTMLAQEGLKDDGLKR